MPHYMFVTIRFNKKRAFVNTSQVIRIEPHILKKQDQYYIGSCIIFSGSELIVEEPPSDLHSFLTFYGTGIGQQMREHEEKMLSDFLNDIENMEE